jgi:hypothetical protein
MKRRKAAPLMRAAVGVAVVVLLCSPTLLAQEKPLDNAEIVKLVKLDMGDAVVIAKIKSVREVRFQTETDDLVKLKAAGVSSAVIAAMLERLGPAPSERAAPLAGGSPRVTLETRDGAVDLKAIFGVTKSQHVFVGVASWVHFNDNAAKIRTRDRRPSVLVESETDPRGGWWYVKVTQDKKDGEFYRYFDVEGGVVSGFGGMAPEPGSVVKCDAVQAQQGVWRLTPVKDLSPGEYGVFTGKGGGQGLLFDFGVDK